MDLEALIRDIPDFPKEGILFRDITPLLAQPEALKEVIDRFVVRFAGHRVHKVIGVESRGFMFAAPLAMRLGAGFVPVRKPGKLPAATISRDYDLEYGSATLEIHRDAIQQGDRVLVVDDLLATGGTLAAAVGLARDLGGEVIGIGIVIELMALEGRRHLDDLPIESLVRV